MRLHRRSATRRTWLLRLLALGAAAGALPALPARGQPAASAERPAADLVLELNVTRKGQVGYGTLFTAAVRRALKGRTAAKTITLTVLTTDSAIEGALTGLQSPLLVEAGFRRGKAAAAPGPAPITGFVDDNKATWHVVYVAVPAPR